MTSKWIFNGLITACLVLAACSISSCNKDKNTVTVDGVVLEKGLDTPLEGATVVFLCSKVTNGVFNAGYSEIDRVTTDASGAFHFEMKEERVSGYRISISKTGYFSSINDISGSDISAGTPYTPTYSVPPEGFVSLRVYNVLPANDDDVIAYSFTSGWAGCYECCDNSMRYGYGASVDQNFTCKTYGNQNVTITWTVTENGNVTQHNYTVVCPAHDTVSYPLFY
jgi:hypothetical protein